MSRTAKAIVFGGSGFIGSHLVRALRERYSDVLVADLVSSSLAGEKGVTFTECDVRRRIECDGSGVAVAYNLAAIHRVPGHTEREYYDTNVGGAINVTDWCTRFEVPVLCFISSISVYGPAEVCKDETSTPLPTTAYGRSKLLAEQVQRQWRSARDGRRLLVVRPAVVFGPGENGNFTRLARALERRRFAYPGRTDVVKACGYVNDLISAIEFALSADELDLTMNFAYPQPYTIHDICLAFRDVAGFSEPPTVPPAAVRAAMHVLRALPGPDDGTLSPARIAKLTTSTHVTPAWLSRSNFTWGTDLASGLHAWRQAPPTGSFV